MDSLANSEQKNNRVPRSGATANGTLAARCGWTLSTGNAWQQHAERLAHWTEERLVNRTDAYGSYLPLGSRKAGKSNNYTAPTNKDLRVPGALASHIIVDHYLGYDQGSLIGLHAISPACTCKWFVIDIDQHGEDKTKLAEANFQAALGWYGELQRRGFHPLLLDSNGAGGFHLLVIFSTAVASQGVHAFATQFVQDHTARELAQIPEVFPKQPDVNEQRRYGNWWRLPGRHHTREHWTRIWNGTKWLDDKAAVDVILGSTGDPPEVIPAETVNRPRRVGVGGPRPRNASSYDSDDWLDILQGTGPGSRHDSLLRLAGYLLGKKVSPPVVEELCVIWNEARNDPPREEEHIRQTVKDLVERDAAAACAVPQTRVYRV
jgi:hypothetical protein